MLADGADMEYKGKDGETVYDKVWLLDFAKPLENEFLVVNQPTIVEDGNYRRPDISILSEDFLAEVRDLPQKNLAYEVLKKLLYDEIRTRSRRNLIQGKSFAEMLEQAINGYKNRGIDTIQVIEELLDLAKKINEADKRGEATGLSGGELAFYDGLADNESAVDVLGDATLRLIASELVKIIRQNIRVDWTLRKNIQAKMRVSVKWLLKKYGYPPDMQKLATENILKQAELLCRDAGLSVAFLQRKAVLLPVEMEFMKLVIKNKQLEITLRNTI
ncbi:Type I restriction-modification system, restriction subunit R [Methanosarcina siciliae C2J]|uniref:Type I restriction-modification system, restriction subunit R n=3 Tax=Methanosarcina siciliae TaxID=38027 RepID=A0A0E3LDS0_9EURY|nr:Type I restriction-modification system, restriction subunit R [Methanosarcina siciliae C2J]